VKKKKKREMIEAAQTKFSTEASPVGGAQIRTKEIKRGREAKMMKGVLLPHLVLVRSLQWPTKESVRASKILPPNITRPNSLMGRRGLRTPPGGA